MTVIDLLHFNNFEWAAMSNFFYTLHFLKPFIMNKKIASYLFVNLLVMALLSGLRAEKPIKIELKNNPSERKVEVLADGKLFTAYIYPEDVKKPVLWPVVSPSGNSITRSYPLATKAGERVDHPHHIGIWLNYGDVNGLDFWNNSTAIPADKASGYGTIVHKSVDKIKNEKNGAELSVSADWIDINKNKLLDEKTVFRFMAAPGIRVIDRKTTLTAVNGDVKFTDNKEGVFAIRVTSELELPAEGAAQLTDAHGNVTKVDKPDLSKVTGNYLSSEGISGEKVWGTRGKWMQLSGKINGENVSVIILDHPANPGYPTYWHARGYGLFAANTLGQKALSNGKDELNFKLAKGQSVTFRYRVIVNSGNDLTPDTINTWSDSFSKVKK
jgi:hypothetical protein